MLGDLLIDLGGTSAPKLSSDLTKAFAERPLTMTFRRAEHEVKDFETSKELGGIFTILATKEVTKMGIRPNREPPQESVQILSVTPKGWAEEQGVQVADHLLMINHQKIRTLPREEYHRLMSSVRPLLFTFARCSETQKREVAATRMQLLYRMRKARQEMKKKKAARDGEGLPSNERPPATTTPATTTPAIGEAKAAPKAPVKTAAAASVKPDDKEGAAAIKIQAVARGGLERQKLALQCAKVEGEEKSQVPYTVLVPAVVSKLGFKTKTFPPRATIAVVNVDPNGWAFKVQIHKGDELVKVQRKVLQLMKASEFTHVVLNQRPLSLTFLPGDQRASRQKGSKGAAWMCHFAMTCKGSQLGQLFIDLVVPESWASSHGVEVNHRLVKMDGYNAARMSADEFARILKLRPLRLEFGHGFFGSIRIYFAEN
eukprot:symbB.v1.2.017970.t1/scaffold1413.1/size120353/2